MKTKSSLGELEMTTGDLTSDSQEKADILNNLFVSVFEDGGTENLPDFQDCPFTEPLHSIEIIENILKKAIDKVKETKSKCPDNIHSMLIKKCKKSLDNSPENYLYKIHGRRKSTGHMESGSYLCHT